MYLTQRSLSHCQQELAVLFETHIGRSGDELVAEPYPDRGERLHAAWHNDHAVVQEATGRGGRGNIRWGVDVVCE
jgi:hypothetical protein